jgi:hypothetical protein
MYSARHYPASLSARVRLINQLMDLNVYLIGQESAHFDPLHMKCRTAQRLREVDFDLYSSMLEKMSKKPPLVGKAN